MSLNLVDDYEAELRLCDSGVEFNAKSYNDRCYLLEIDRFGLRIFGSIYILSPNNALIIDGVDDV